jgi:hypothetical protein
MTSYLRNATSATPASVQQVTTASGRIRQRYKHE